MVYNFGDFSKMVYKWRHLCECCCPALEARACPMGVSHSPRGRTGVHTRVLRAIPRRLLVLAESAAGSPAQPGQDPSTHTITQSRLSVTSVTYNFKLSKKYFDLFKIYPNFILVCVFPLNSIILNKYIKSFIEKFKLLNCHKKNTFV